MTISLSGFNIVFNILTPAAALTPACALAAGYKPRYTVNKFNHCAESGDYREHIEKYAPTNQPRFFRYKPAEELTEKYKQSA